MASKPRVLVLYASGQPSWRRIVADSARDTLRVGPDGAIAGVLRALGWHERFFGQPYDKLSYVVDWLEAFVEHEQLSAIACNINSVPAVARAALGLRARRFDAVVLLHSTTGDSLAVLRRLSPVLAARRAPLLVFVGNEYNLLADKLAFLSEVRADVVATQLPLDAGRFLYAGFLARQPRGALVALPAALHPRRYAPRAGQPGDDVDTAGRTTDVGFRGQGYPPHIGDDERNRLLRELPPRARATGMNVDVELSPVSRAEWAALLQRTRCVPGAEAGTRFLDPSDELWRAVDAVLREVPGATFDDVYRRVFAQRAPSGPSGKAISSRHFEAAGAGCCQVLVRGRYNDILHAEEHYLPVAADLSDLGDVVDQMRDTARCAAVARRARAHVLAHHTYRHRVDAAMRALGVPIDGGRA